MTVPLVTVSRTEGLPEVISFYIVHDDDVPGVPGTNCQVIMVAEYMPDFLATIEDCIDYRMTGCGVARRAEVFDAVIAAYAEFTVAERGS